MKTQKNLSSAVPRSMRTLPSPHSLLQSFVSSFVSFVSLWFTSVSLWFNPVSLWFNHRRYRFYLYFCLPLLLIGLHSGLHSCAPANSPTAIDNKPNVISTSTIITDWTSRIGGSEIDLIGILKPGNDPHVYEPVPADTQAIEQANLILYNGYNLEPGLIRIMESVGANARKVAVGEVVQPLQLEKESVTVPDPHVWGNAQNAIAMTQAIRDALIELSPSDRTLFTQNADQLIAELQKLDTWIRQTLQTIPANQRRLITTHDAFQYYARAYGLEVSGTLIGISTEEQPSAQTIQKLVAKIKETNVPTIFAETTINPQLITTVAQEANVKLATEKLYSDSIGAAGSGAETYTKMMVANTRSITQNLGGKYVPPNF